MEAKENIPQELYDLAQRLNSSDTEVAAQLQGLARAFGNPSERIDAWAGLDLEKVFPPAKIAETLLASHIFWCGVVRMFRNLAIFLPLVATWFSLWNHQGLGQLSLQSIVTVAPINLFVFAMLILLTLVHEFYEMVIEHIQTRNERQIAGLLRRCTLRLSEAKSGQPIAFTLAFQEIGDELLNKMVALQGEMDSVAQTRKTEIIDLQLFIADFKSGAADINSAGKKLNTAVNKTSTYLANLESTISALSGLQTDAIRATDDMKRAMNAIVASQSVVVAKLGDNTGQLKSAVDDLNVAYAAAKPVMQDMRDTTAGLANAHIDFLDRMAKLVQDQKHTYQAMDSLLNQVNGVVAELNRVAGNNALPVALNGASSAMLNLQGEIEAFVREQRKSLHLLEETNRSLKSLPVPVSTETNLLPRP